MVDRCSRGSTKQALIMPQASRQPGADTSQLEAWGARSQSSLWADGYVVREMEHWNHSSVKQGPIFNG